MRSTDEAAPATASRARLVGVDAARGVALFGMMATHLIPLVAEGDTSWAIVFAGRASALFAVLAGIGIALSVSRAELAAPRGWIRASAGLATRAAIIIAIGLTLAAFDTGLAVILVHYGILFLLAVPFLRLPALPLALLGGTWMIAMPLAVHAWRGWAQPAPFDYGNPQWTDLLDPGPLLVELLATGYYPVLLWFGYLLLGMALGRMALDSARICLSLAMIGTGIAIAAKMASETLLAMRGWSEIAAEYPTSTDLQPFTLDYIARVSGFGVVPEGTWWWQTVSGPHTGTPFDLVHTAGTAVAVIGVLGLITAAGRIGRGLLAPLAWPGSMPLTVYTCHVLVMTGRDAADPLLLLIGQIIAAILLAGLWRLLSARFGWHRGPLEGLTARASRAVRDLIPAAGGDETPLQSVTSDVGMARPGPTGREPTMRGLWKRDRREDAVGHAPTPNPDELRDPPDAGWFQIAPKPFSGPRSWVADPPGRPTGWSDPADLPGPTIANRPVRRFTPPEDPPVGSLVPPVPTTGPLAGAPTAAPRDRRTEGPGPTSGHSGAGAASTEGEQPRPAGDPRPRRRTRRSRSALIVDEVPRLGGQAAAALFPLTPEVPLEREEPLATVLMHPSSSALLAAARCPQEGIARERTASQPQESADPETLRDEERAAEIRHDSPMAPARPRVRPATAETPSPAVDRAASSVAAPAPAPAADRTGEPAPETAAQEILPEAEADPAALGLIPTAPQEILDDADRAARPGSPAAEVPSPETAEASPVLERQPAADTTSETVEASPAPELPPVVDAPLLAPPADPVLLPAPELPWASTVAPVRPAGPIPSVVEADSAPAPPAHAPVKTPAPAASRTAAGEAESLPPGEDPEGPELSTAPELSSAADAASEDHAEERTAGQRETHRGSGAPLSSSTFPLPLPEVPAARAPIPRASLDAPAAPTAGLGEEAPRPSVMELLARAAAESPPAPEPEPDPDPRHVIQAAGRRGPDPAPPGWTDPEPSTPSVRDAADPRRVIQAAGRRGPDPDPSGRHTIPMPHRHLPAAAPERAAAPPTVTPVPAVLPAGTPAVPPGVTPAVSPGVTSAATRAVEAPRGRHSRVESVPPTRVDAVVDSPAPVETPAVIPSTRPPLPRRRDVHPRTCQRD